MNPTRMLTAIMLAWLVAAGPTAFAQMQGMNPTSNPTPPVNGFYKGQPILFIHTEASDTKVADMLTKMMGPKVLVVPNLAKISANLLGNVYAFRNGVRGEGPFGFQSDVFDSAPGDPTYTPLRAVNLVDWIPQSKPRILRSAEEIKNARSGGEITVKRPGIVVNMPMLTWPGGKR